MQKMTLITTALEDSWCSDDNLVFLGEWCKKHSRLSTLVGIQHQTIPYHWADRVKFLKDEIYLKALHEDLVHRMHVTLNDYHQTNHSKKYWRIVVGPWLAVFIPSLFDRWECLSAAFNLHKYDVISVNNNETRDLIRPDYNSSALSLQEDEWNYCLYSDMIKKRFGNGQCRVSTSIRSKSTRTISRTLKQKLIGIIDNLLSRLQTRYDVALVHTYLGAAATIKLSVKLKQFPRNYQIFKQVIPEVDAIDNFRRSDIGLDARNAFEAYINESVLQLIPSSYLERYSDLCDIADQVKDKVKVILTANAHFSNDILKIWSARQVEYHKTRFLLSSHGGCLTSKFSSFQTHEEKIADSRIVWHAPLTKKQVQLPAIKYVGRKVPVAVREDIVTLIGLGFGLFSYGMQSGPYSSLMLDEFEQKKQFLNCSINHFNRKIGYFPPANQSWEFQSRFYDFIDEERISSFPDYHQALKKSKLVICSYPQTTFSDALFYGVPVVLLYTEKYWTFPSHFDFLLEELKRVKIVFNDPILAATHINEIWDDPDEWWNSEEVKQVSLLLRAECVNFSESDIIEWHTFLKKQVQPLL